MKTEIHRLDYRAPDFSIDKVELTFQLDFERTLVQSTLLVRKLNLSVADLVLDGEELELLEIALDGVPMAASGYQINASSLTLFKVPEQFELCTMVAIAPSKNTRLEGLYRSGEFILTQCEAEGFRRITYYLDRPDVMSRFNVSLIADPIQFPVLLANGNPLNEVKLADGRIESRWYDPHPKPSYLFALAAGKLEYLEDWYQTEENRKVRIRIYSQADAIARCEFALAAVKRAMRWDEIRFGLNYDLDVFNIVATHDFNMGAMENKGLNIFNAKFIVADKNTATDSDFENVEAVIGHEYFHNWTGNRVTCRDWFQLSLKEGLTVFRDQEFTADLHSRGIKRINDVRALRANQFPEDSGPFAHSVRPESYLEINNFYTMTIYEKGAEVVRMVQTMLGVDGFRKGMDLYFLRHDGQAVSCDDFRAAMADANEVDLDQFELWYQQAGTPTLKVKEIYDAEQKRYTLSCKQHTPDTPGQSGKLPQVIPIKLSLYNKNGTPFYLRNGQAQVVVVMNQSEQEFIFNSIESVPVASILQDYSAPVKLQFVQSCDDLACLARVDLDPFNRVEAMQRLAQEAILNHYQQAEDGSWSEAWILAAQKIVSDAQIDLALMAELINLPDFTYLGELIIQLDPHRLLQSMEKLETEFVARCEPDLLHRYTHSAPNTGDVASDAKARRIRHRVLDLLTRHGAESNKTLAFDLYQNAHNMTELSAALSILVRSDSEFAAQASADFYARYQNDALVLDKWFAIHASAPQSTTLSSIKMLMQDPAFGIHNPNKVRALFGSFARQNPKQFHALDGSGYEFIADQVAMLDGINPQIAARLVAVFNAWRKLEAVRSQLMFDQLRQLQTKVQSPDVKEIVERALS